MSSDQSFRAKRQFTQRQIAAMNCLEKYPEKVPVIIERIPEEKILPLIDKTKFLVPKHIQVSELQKIIRRRLDLNQNQSMYLLINSKTACVTSKVMSQVYEEFKDEDGFLYISYGSYEFFG